MAMNLEPMEMKLQRAIRSEIERIVAEEAVEAGKRVEQRVRERTGAIAGAVLEHFSFERMGNTLRIVVDFENTKTKGC